ncbi:hypothetical protein U9M48_018518 [Paspalum notatum var. saurae]|uniref:Uncharacterized protein n=1 Tax=Paspalum notatum var. saurae TaxID=547442 RepID=A0AAQ3TD30_PASNO
MLSHDILRSTLSDWKHHKSRTLSSIPYVHTLANKERLHPTFPVGITIGAKDGNFPGVECPKYPGFCLTRQKNEYPFLEVFYNPEQAGSQGKSVDPNITKYSVKVLPFNYDQSVYGFREYFRKHGFKYSETN